MEPVTNKAAIRTTMAHNVMLPLLVLIFVALSSCATMKEESKAAGSSPVRLLAACVNNDKCGYITPKGEVIIKPQFYGAADFSEGLADARINHGDKYGYIDKEGKFVINPQFDDVDHFKEGLASVKIGDKWGYIDKTGKIVIDPQFDRAICFHEGLASVMIGGKWGYIDKAGKIVINPQFDIGGGILAKVLPK